MSPFFIPFSRIFRPSPSHFHYYCTSSYFVMDAKDMYARKEAECKSLKEQVELLDSIVAQLEKERLPLQVTDSSDRTNSLGSTFTSLRQLRAFLDEIHDSREFWHNCCVQRRNDSAYWMNDAEKYSNAYYQQLKDLENRNSELRQLRKLLEAKDVEIAKLQSNANAVQQVQNEIMLQVQHNLEKVCANVAEMQIQAEDEAQNVL